MMSPIMYYSPDRVGGRIDLPPPTPPDMRVRVRRFRSDERPAVARMSSYKDDPGGSSEGLPCFPPPPLSPRGRLALMWSPVTTGSKPPPTSSALHGV